MKNKKISLLISLLCCFIANSRAQDLSGYYKTKEDFENNNIIIVPEAKLRTFMPKAYFPFSLDFDETINLKNKSTRKIKILSDSIFAFRVSGVLFIANQQEKKYLSVLNAASPVYLFLKEKHHYRGVYSPILQIPLYSITINGPIKELTQDNINTDFKDNIDLQLKLNTILEKAKKQGLTYYLDRKDYATYTKMVKGILYEQPQINKFL